MKIVLQRLDDDRYLVYNSITRGKFKMTREQLLACTDVTGVSEDDIVMYDSFDDYVETMATLGEMTDTGVQYLRVPQFNGSDKLMLCGISSVLLREMATNTGVIRFADYCDTTAPQFNPELWNKRFRVIDCRGVNAVKFTMSEAELDDTSYPSLETLYLPMDSFTVSYAEFRNSPVQHVICGQPRGYVTPPIDREESRLGDSSFNGCGNLQDVDLSKYHIQSIPTDCFAQCSGVHKIKLPDTVTLIGDSAFKGCKSLKSLHLPDGVVRIGSRAFEDSGITEMTVPKGVESIMPRSFRNCKNLKELTLQGVDTVVDVSVFEGCTHLRKCDLGDKLQHLCLDVFNACKELNEVHLPLSVAANISCGRIAEHSPTFVVQYGSATHWKLMDLVKDHKYLKYMVEN